jgi:hypothetical protein
MYFGQERVISGRATPVVHTRRHAWRATRRSMKKSQILTVPLIIPLHPFKPSLALIDIALNDSTILIPDLRRPRSRDPPGTKRQASSFGMTPRRSDRGAKPPIIRIPDSPTCLVFPRRPGDDILDSVPSGPSQDRQFWSTD